MGYREVKTNCRKIYSLKVKNGDQWRIEGVYCSAIYDNFGLNKQSVVQKYIIDNTRAKYG